MEIAIIDADLLGRKSQRFPNLACMKISNYHKSIGNKTKLILNWDELKIYFYDKIYLSKVFSDTLIPEWVMGLNNLEYGGTGFFYDKAPKLNAEIEHSKPDYNLYDKFVEKQLLSGESNIKLKYYTDYMIGFYTRGCFRKCGFCVNKNYNKVENHSEIEEWWDDSKKKICLLDDNFLGYPDWKEKLQKLIDTKKPFQFKQGLDIRLMTEEKAEMLSSSKYDGHFIFAFDNIEDKNIIDNKLKLWMNYNKKKTTLYCFTGFDRNNLYDSSFQKQDFIDLFDRIKILIENNCYPYIMRHENYNNLKHKGMYINITRWCNQPNIFSKMSLMEFIIADCNRTGKEENSTMRYFKEFKKDFPDLVDKYFNIKLNNK